MLISEWCLKCKEPEPPLSMSCMAAQTPFCRIGTVWAAVWTDRTCLNRSASGQIFHCKLPWLSLKMTQPNIPDCSVQTSAQSRTRPPRFEQLYCVLLLNWALTRPFALSSNFELNWRGCPDCAFRFTGSRNHRHYKYWVINPLIQTQHLRRILKAVQPCPCAILTPQVQ
jgi:hypothetical protein